MKGLNRLMAVVIVALSLTVPARAEVTLSSGVRFNTFQDDLTEPAKGNEVTFPLSMLYTRKAFAVRLVTAYSRARLTPADGAERTIATLTDTLLAVAYTLPLPKLPLQLGVTLNLPTGKTRLDEQEAQALAGKDNNVLEVSSFGEGFNVGFSLGTAKKFGNVTVGVNGAYTVKGKYTPRSQDPADELDPGDQLLTAAMVQWQVLPAITVGGGVTYVYLTADQVNGQESSQAGSSVTLKTNFQARPVKPLGLTLTLLYQIPQKSQELAGETLRTEADNSKGTLFAGIFEATYAYSKTLLLQVVGGVRYYAESPRQDSGSGQPYAGKRLRYSFGPGVTYAVNKQLSCQVIAAYGILREDPDITQREQTTTTGVNMNLGVKYQF